MKDLALHIYRGGGPIEPFYRVAVTLPVTHSGLGHQIQFKDWKLFAELLQHTLHIDQEACDAIKLMADADGTAELDDLELSDEALHDFGFLS